MSQLTIATPTATAAEATSAADQFRALEFHIESALDAACDLARSPHPSGCPCLCCRYETLPEVPDVAGALRMLQAWLGTHH